MSIFIIFVSPQTNNETNFYVNNQKSSSDPGEKSQQGAGKKNVF